MTYHKIRGIDKTICTAEAKIAYNLANTYAYEYRKKYRKSANNFTRIAITDFISEAVNYCFNHWKNNKEYQSGHFDDDAIESCLRAGMENYFNEPYGILTSYEAIGKVFPSLYL